MENRGVKKGLEGRIRNTDLVKARESLGLTQGEAAERIGIGKASLCHYETLRTYPSDATQKKICSFYSRSGYSLNEKNAFPEYMEVIATRRSGSGKGNDMPAEMMVPLSSVNESYQMNTAKIDAKCLVDELLKDLHPRYKEILTGRFGLKGELPATLAEVAKKYNLGSRERVRQIEANALRELRKKAYGYIRKGML